MSARRNGERHRRRRRGRTGRLLAGVEAAPTAGIHNGVTAVVDADTKRVIGSVGSAQLDVRRSSPMWVKASALPFMSHGIHGQCQQVEEHMVDPLDLGREPDHGLCLDLARWRTCVRSEVDAGMQHVHAVAAGDAAGLRLERKAAAGGARQQTRGEGHGHRIIPERRVVFVVDESTPGGSRAVDGPVPVGILPLGEHLGILSR